MTQSSLHYNEFISSIVMGNDVYTVFDSGGYPAPFGDGGKRAMPFWSSENRVKLIIKNVKAYSGMKVERIKNGDFIHKWLSELANDQLNVGCNWSGKSARGYDCSPDDIANAIKSRIMANK